MLLMDLISRQIRACVGLMKATEIETLFWEDYEVPNEIKCAIKSLFSLEVGDLRNKYYEVHGYHTNSRNKDFLLKKIAWGIQANFFGDISEDTKKKAYEIADFTRLRVRKNKPRKLTSLVGMYDRVVSVNLSRDPRLPMPGALLCKNYNGKLINVKVLEKGFEYEDRIYNSLSAIARKVSGTNWNGYKFFEL